MEQITTLDELDESGYLFTVVEHDSGDEREAFVVPTQDGVEGWFNYCQHITTINIDKGRGLPRRGDQVVCQNHGAMFNVDDGLCTHGPCEGASLEPLSVAVRDNVVYLDDDEYHFGSDGGINDDDGPTSTTGEFF